jgi:hypothetical protein
LGARTICIFLFLFGILGCAGRKPPPRIEPVPYTGPEAAFAVANGAHAIDFRAGSPGWQVRLDQVRSGWRHQQAFVTIRRPNPAYVYPQVRTSQLVATSVPVDTPLMVYARVGDFSTPDDELDAYTLVLQTPQPQRTLKTTLGAP